MKNQSMIRILLPCAQGQIPTYQRVEEPVLRLLQVSPRLYAVRLAQIRYGPIVPAGCAKRIFRPRGYKPVAGIEFGVATKQARHGWVVDKPPTGCIGLKRHHPLLLGCIGQPMTTVTASAIFKVHNVIASLAGK
jgi:hypothetical protein